MPDTWGLTDDGGQSIITAQSFIKIEVSQDGDAVSDPIEKNSFATYNKTTSPASITAELAFTGDDAYLAGILDTLKKLKEGVELFSLVTPITEYPNFTLVSFSYTRTREEGYGTLYVSLSLVEVREADIAFAQTEVSDPSDAGAADGGQVQTKKAEEKPTSIARKGKDILFGGAAAPEGAKK